jgi:uncharacterized membrane protein
MEVLEVEASYNIGTPALIINSLDGRKNVRYLDEMQIDVELLACGIAGLLIASYITLVSFGLLSPRARFVPRVCRLDEDTCRRVIRTPEAKMFGIPNSLVGMGYYGGLLLYAGAGPWRANAARLALTLSVVALGASLHLGYTLLVKLRTGCALCYASHALNGIIALIMISRAI